ncbi:leucine-rich repeat domain-containing protein [Spirosoma endbachense]|nr:leucine-rich repeat domain-containing protein [Spirosoma endbachense]
MTHFSTFRLPLRAFTLFISWLLVVLLTTTVSAQNPTISGFAATLSTACAGSPVTFTATVGNVTGGYAYTLTNGSSPLTGSSSSTSFSQSLVVSGSGSQSFSLVVNTAGGSAVATTTLTVGSHPDYQPLVDLYNNNNGSNWTNKTRWLTSCDPCTGNGGFPWYGVGCLAGRVNRLDLQNNGLSGSIPASLSALTNLQELNLSANQLSGNIPTSLSALTNLQRLTLSVNQLSGSIPASLSVLTNLQSLGLSNNQLSGSIPASLSALTNLQELTLNNNQLSGSIPATIGSLTKLQYLDLTTNQLSSIPESMGSLINLQELKLNDNRLSGSIPESMGSLANLQSLSLYNNQLSGGIPASLGSLTNLSYLALFNNQLSGSIPESMGSLTNLTVLSLNNNQLSGSIPGSLASLTNLQSLGLSTNQLSGCWPASLTALCGRAFNSFFSNAGLPGGGSNSAFAAFCGTGQGSEAFVPTASASAPTVNVGGVVSLSTAGGSSYSWIAPAGAQLWSPATTNVVSATLTQAGLQTFTVVVSNGTTCSQTATVSVTGTGSALPTLSGFAATLSTVCSGSPVTFTATVGNVTGGYAYTLTNGSSPLTGSSSSTSFSQSLVVSGSGSQSFSLVVNTAGGSAVATTTLTVGSHPDYQPLVDFYNSTNGSGWTNKTGWLQSCDPCTGNGGNPWFGVTCSGGRVNQLLLSSNGLSGSIPASLGSLTNLQTLNLVTNQLSGSIPASVGNLTNLQLLYLASNQLSGSIPASLSALTNLQTLNLSVNQLSGDIPASLGSMANLQQLELFNNQITGSIPATLGSLTNLKFLRLNDNQLSGSIPTTLGSLTNLTLLTLSTNQLSGSIPSTLGSMINLQQLFLSGNQLSGSIPASLSALTNLTSLNLSENQLSASIPSSLGSLTNLQVLTLSTNQLSGSIPSTLGSLTNLQNLFLYDNQLSGSIPATLGNLTNLTTLYLHSNQLSGCWPASLSAFCGVSSKSFANNAGLPGGGSNSAFAAFCATGQGSEAFVPTASASTPTVNVGGVVSLSTAGGSSYSWIAPAGAQLSSPATASVVSATLTQAGLQTFTVVVSNGTTCSQTATVSITVSSVQPTLAGLAPTPSVVCVGSPVTFTATLGNVTGSYAYTLTNGSNPLTGSSSSTSFSQSLVAASSGNQSFSLIIRSNDLSASATTSLLVNALPTPSLQASGTLSCATSSVTLTASGGASYSFSGPGLVSQNGETGTAVVNEAGTYSVTVTSTGGCTASTSVSVSADQTAPSVSISPTSATLTCANPSVTLTANGSGPFRWNTGSTESQISVNTPGTYSVTMTSGNSCSAVATTTVEPNSNLKAPTLLASAPSTTNQPISVTASGCAGTINWLPQGGTGLANGEVYTFTQPGNYSLSASCTLGSCTSPQATPLSLQILPGSFAITKVTMVNCTLIDQPRGRYQVQFTPLYVGNNANPISFSVVNEMPTTTAPAPYSLQLYNDNPVITLVANQAGNSEARFAYNWLASCQTGNNPNSPPTTSGIPNQTILAGQAYQLQLTNYFSDPDGQALTFSVTGLPAGLNLNGSLISGTPSSTGVSSVQITALDPGGLSAQTSFQLTVNPMPTSPAGFTIVGVSTVSCAVLSPGLRRVTFTPQYGGTDSSPISFSVVNELVATTNPGPYSLNLYTDNPAITLTAKQGGSLASFVYNWLSVCNPPARVGSGEAPTGLQVTVLGNPIEGNSVELEIRGVVGQAVELNLVDLQGKVLHQQRLEKAGSVERGSVPIGTGKGIILLQVHTATEHQQVKLLRP